jgi:cytochrome bd-type quinol oxidase subunit 2
MSSRAAGVFPPAKVPIKTGLRMVVLAAAFIGLDVQPEGGPDYVPDVVGAVLLLWALVRFLGPCHPQFNRARTPALVVLVAAFLNLDDLFRPLVDIVVIVDAVATGVVAWLVLTAIAELAQSQKAERLHRDASLAALAILVLSAVSVVVAVRNAFADGPLLAHVNSSEAVVLTVVVLVALAFTVWVLAIPLRAAKQLGGAR